jgi:protein-S-isoprenylcysteine O-methyltransferase Ste14
MRALETRIPPPIVALLTAAAMCAVARWLPLVSFHLPRATLLGIFVAAVGGIVSTAGTWSFRRAKTTVNPLHPERASSIVTTGIYRYTRNPMYLGLLLVLAGLFLALGDLSAALGPAAFVWYISRFQVAPEERALQAKFGAEYVAYQARVRRWL